MISRDEAFDLASPLGGGGFKYGDAQGDVTHEFALAVIKRHEDRRAAADDLYEALSMLVDDVQDYEAWQRPCAALDKAKAALAKARGETI